MLWCAHVGILPNFLNEELNCIVPPLPGILPSASLSTHLLCSQGTCCLISRTKKKAVRAIGDPHSELPQVPQISCSRFRYQCSLSGLQKGVYDCNAVPGWRNSLLTKCIMQAAPSYLSRHKSVLEAISQETKHLFIDIHGKTN